MEFFRNRIDVFWVLLNIFGQHKLTILEVLETAPFFPVNPKFKQFDVIFAVESKTLHIHSTVTISVYC